MEGKIQKKIGMVVDSERLIFEEVQLCRRAHNLMKRKKMGTNGMEREENEMTDYRSMGAEKRDIIYTGHLA